MITVLILLQLIGCFHFSLQDCSIITDHSGHHLTIIDQWWQDRIYNAYGQLVYYNLHYYETKLVCKEVAPKEIISENLSSRSQFAFVIQDSKITTLTFPSLPDKILSTTGIKLAHNYIKFIEKNSF